MTKLKKKKNKKHEELTERRRRRRKGKKKSVIEGEKGLTVDEGYAEEDEFEGEGEK